MIFRRQRWSRFTSIILVLGAACENGDDAVGDGGALDGRTDSAVEEGGADGGGEAGVDATDDGSAQVDGQQAATPKLDAGWDAEAATWLHAPTAGRAVSRKDEMEMRSHA